MSCQNPKIVERFDGSWYEMECGWKDPCLLCESRMIVDFEDFVSYVKRNEMTKEEWLKCWYKGVKTGFPKKEEVVVWKKMNNVIWQLVKEKRLDKGFLSLTRWLCTKKCCFNFCE